MLWRYNCVYVCMHIVIPRGSRAHFKAASMEKSPILRFFTVFELSEDMWIGQDKSRQHFDRCLLKLGNIDPPLAEQLESIHIPPENLCKVQGDSGIAITIITTSAITIRHFMVKIFPDINANFHVESLEIFGLQSGQYKHQKTAKLIRLLPLVRKINCMGKRDKCSLDWFDKLPSLINERRTRSALAALCAVNHCQNTHIVHTIKLLFYLIRIAVNI